MKQFQQAFFTLSVLTIVFLSCKKEYSYEIPGGANTSVYQWSFSEGANAFKGPMDTAYVDTVNSKRILTMVGESTDNKSVISLLVIADSIQVGTYQTANASFDYIKSGSPIYQSDLTAIGQFTITITAIDSISITGTFSGTALDSAGNKKSITAGAFKVRFKSNVTASLTNCAISKILYTDSTTGDNYFAESIGFQSNAASNIYLLDSTSPAQIITSGVTGAFPVSYASGKTTVSADGKQYFTLDANGRATAFYGYEDPLIDTTPPIVATFTYDGNGRLITRTHAYQTAPGTVVATMSYTWSGNELTQATLTSGGIMLAQVTYQYDGSKSVKAGFTAPPYAAEIYFFQWAVNTGVVPDEPLTQVTEVIYDPTTQAVTGTNVSVLYNYTLDASSHITNFSLKGDDFMAMTLRSDVGLYNQTNYTLSYHCN